MLSHADGFDEFYRGDFIPLVGFLQRKGHGFEESRDAAAEAMCCALRNWANVTSPHAWVRIAAQRIVLRDLNRRRQSVDRAIRATAGADDCSPDPSTEVVGRFRVIALLAHLPPKQREVMNWYIDGFKTHEIAEALDIAEATVRSTKRHALKVLKVLIEEAQLRSLREEERGYGS